MELLIIDGGFEVLPAPELVKIKAFQDLIKRDKGSPGDSRGKRKLRATRELTYIYHCVSFKSPYANLHFDMREQSVRHDMFPDGNWEPDAIVMAAMAKYEQLTTTSSIQMLISGLRASQKLTKYFDNIDLEVTDDDGKLLHSAKDLVANLGNLGKVVDGLNKLKQQVQNETEGDNANRKSVETNKYSE